MPGKTKIKVTSVLFIIGAIVSIITYTIAGLLFEVATVDTGEKYGMLFVAVCVLYTIFGILELIAGIKGIKGCGVKEAAPSLKKWGYVLLVIALICGIMNAIQYFLKGESILYAILGVLLSLVIPGFYIYGASQNKNA